MPRVISRRSQGAMRKLRKPSITIWPASVPVRVEFWPEASNATANNVLAMPTPRIGLSSLIGVLNFRHVLVSRPMKGGGREDENGGVDEEGEHEGDAGIDRGELDRLAFSCRRPLEFARLHDGGMQIEIMRHDGRAEDADARRRAYSGCVRISVLGIKPSITPVRLGLAKKSSEAKQPPMVTMSVTTTASM